MWVYFLVYRSKNPLPLGRGSSNQPNKQTINNFDDDFIDVISSKKQLTLHEKIFLQNYDIKDEN